MCFIIVEIWYLLGIGVIIIVCCVFWDLYSVYLCLIIDVDFYCFLDEDNDFVSKLVEWIFLIEEICNIFLLIFIDGKKLGFIEGFFNKFLWIF